MLKFDIAATARCALSTAGAINIPVLAEQVRKRNEAENVALEDIEYALLYEAQIINAVVEFDRTLR